MKSLGATLKTFSPTIRELASVTNELSSTLQQQIGLDDIRNEFRNPSPTYTKYAYCFLPSPSLFECIVAAIDTAIRKMYVLLKSSLELGPR